MKNVTYIFTSGIKEKKRLFILSIIILVFSGPGFALDPMGPPVADMEPGQYQFGFDFSYTNMDLKLYNGD